MRCAIIQPNYLPWKGYFDIINDVDVFVFLDDVQYTKNDWRNRNRIKTSKGTEWITVPVLGGIHQKIFETPIDYSKKWEKKHKNTLHANYAASEYYESYSSDIYEIYSKKYDSISQLSICTIKKICQLLEIDTKFLYSSDLDTKGKKEDKVIEICSMIGANEYISGPTAKNYIHNEKFENAGIDLYYKDYSYPEYPQLWGEFNPFVSIVDTLFNCGDKAQFYIWGWRYGA